MKVRPGGIGRGILDQQMQPENTSRRGILDQQMQPENTSRRLHSSRLGLNQFGTDLARQHSYRIGRQHQFV
jgi:hypothetical protein